MPTVPSDSSQSIPQSPDATARTADYARKKLRILWWMTGYALLLGTIPFFLNDESEDLSFVVGLPLLLLALWWCFTDADERRHRIGGFMRGGLVLLFVAAFPIYLFQTRGWGGFKTLAAALVFTVFLCVCMSISEF